MSASPPFICPVCGNPNLAEPPYSAGGAPSYEICLCCGFEFGFDDESNGLTHQAYRKKWIADGANWFDPDEKPQNWVLEAQIANLD